MQQTAHGLGLLVLILLAYQPDASLWSACREHVKRIIHECDREDTSSDRRQLRIHPTELEALERQTRIIVDRGRYRRIYKFSHRSARNLPVYSEIEAIYDLLRSEKLTRGQKRVIEYLIEQDTIIEFRFDPSGRRAFVSGVWYGFNVMQIGDKDRQDPSEGVQSILHEGGHLLDRSYSPLSLLSNQLYLAGMENSPMNQLLRLSEELQANRINSPEAPVRETAVSYSPLFNELNQRINGFPTRDLFLQMTLGDSYRWIIPFLFREGDRMFGRPE